MIIKEDIVDKYIDNRLEFDLPNLSLKNKEYSISGSGTIKLDYNGILELKIFSRKKNSIPFEHFIKQYNKSLTDAGKLIPKEDYFILSSKNNRKTHFLCKQISVHNCDENIIKGTLMNSLEILSPDFRERKYKNAEIIINSNIKIPINGHQNTEKTYSTGDKFTNLSMNTFIIKNQGVTIQMFNKKNYFLIGISAEKQIIDTLYIDNLISSLSFVTGKIIRWNILKLFSDSDKYRYFYNSNNTQKKGSTLSKPPFDFITFIEKSEQPEKLFTYYLNFINTDSKRILYKITNRNLLSSYSYLHVFGLTLSANIEELLKVYFSKYVKSNIIQPDDISDTINKIKEINIKESLKNRIIGLLQNISNNNIHVKDIFKMLQNKKILDKENIKIWDKLRNASAHGDTTDNFDTQSHLDLVYKNLVLYYKIIFLLIGYKGLYSNYCIYGHPCDSFDNEI